MHKAGANGYVGQAGVTCRAQGRSKWTQVRAVRTKAQSQGVSTQNTGTPLPDHCVGCCIATAAAKTTQSGYGRTELVVLVHPPNSPAAFPALPAITCRPPQHPRAEDQVCSETAEPQHDLLVHTSTVF